MDDKKFESDLARHKKLIVSLIESEREENLFIIPTHELGENLCLAFANCKCEKCQATENLQFHHLISKYYKRFGIKYAIQRIYWANIMVLCKKCHAEIEQRKLDDGDMIISIERINKVMRRYNIIPT